MSASHSELCLLLVVAGGTTLVKGQVKLCICGEEPLLLRHWLVASLLILLCARHLIVCVFLCLVLVTLEDSHNEELCGESNHTEESQRTVKIYPHEALTVAHISERALHIVFAARVETWTVLANLPVHLKMVDCKDASEEGEDKAVEDELLHEQIDCPR